MGRKELNPADVYRKQQRKKDLKKCKETRNVVRSVQELLSDPNKIEEEIQKAQKESDASQLDKGLKDRIKELKMMKSVAMTKQKIDIASGKTDRDAAAQLKETELLERANRRLAKIEADKNRGREGEVPSSYQQQPDNAATSQSSSSSQEPSSSQRSAYAPPVFVPPPTQRPVLPPSVGIAPGLFAAVGVPPPAPVFRPPPPMPKFLGASAPPSVPIVAASGLQPPPMPTFRPIVSSGGIAPAIAPALLLSGPENHTESHAEADSSSSAISPPTVDDPAAYSFLPAGFVMPNMADLMKRRMALTDETETVIVRDDGSHDVESYPAPGPSVSYDPNEEGSDREEEDDDREEEMHDEVDNTDSIKRTEVPVPKMLMGGIGGLTDYGSDSDGDDYYNDGKESASPEKKAVVVDVPRFIPRSFPIALTKYSEPSYLPSMVSQAPISTAQPTQTAPASFLAQPTRIQAVSAPSTAADDDMADFFRSVEDQTSAPPERVAAIAAVISDAKPQKPVLKSIARDSALTAFLPTSLRIKRPALQSGLGNVSKVPRSVDNTDSAVSSSVTATGTKGGVEDAYLNFLDEIGELTG